MTHILAGLGRDLRSRLLDGNLGWPNRQQLMEVWQLQACLLERQAVFAAKWAYSYRSNPVHIGCAVMGFDGMHFDASHIGWNTTLFRLPEASKRLFKPCAEKFAVIECLSRLQSPVGMCIYTTHNQPDDETGLLLDAFICCNNCANWMETLLPPWFIIRSIRPRLPTDPPGDGPYFTLNTTLDELLLMHQDSLHW